MNLVKEAQFVSILAHPHLDSCSNAISSQDKQLTFAFAIKGTNSTSFCKDIVDEISTWQISNAEQLHQKILDLLSSVRQKGLEIEFALSLLVEEQIIFATYSGNIILKRNYQTRKILESVKEVKIVVGNFRENDQIILINKSATGVEGKILRMLSEEASLEKMISELSLIQQEYGDHNESIAFLTYQNKISEEEARKKFDYKVAAMKAVQITGVGIEKIVEISKKILKISKIIISKIKNQDKKKLAISAAIFFAIGLFIFASIAIQKNQNQKIVDNIRIQVEEINKSTSNINQLILEQPLLARDNAQKNLNSLEALRQEKNNKDSLKLINQEIKKIKELIAEIAGNNSLDKLSVIYNLENFIASKIEFKENQIFLLENNGKEILRIKTDGSKEKITLQNNEQIRDFTVSENKLFILNNGIKMLDLSKNDLTFITIKEEGESDKNGELLSSFGPYLYLLNKEKRNIYRYYYNDDKLSEPIGWLVDKQGINFDSISSLMVDGDLWVGMKNGNLSKFSKGSNTDFQIKGLEQILNSSIVLSANEITNSTAILEKQNKRLIVITKDGQLINEIKSNELSGVSSIAFNSDGRKIYALSGSIIYEIEVLK